MDGTIIELTSDILKIESRDEEDGEMCIEIFERRSFADDYCPKE